MRYILDARYRLRGWHGAPAGIYDTKQHRATFVDQALYRLLLHCDAVHDIASDALTDRESSFLERLRAEGVIRPAGTWDFLLPAQQYRAYPARYRLNVHWSITGACNLRCRHCFMSAPHAKHGSPSREELMNVVEQFAECGVFTVTLTGGEPLIREDFLDIVDALLAHEIVVTAINTNGWLVDEELLDALEAKGVHPTFMVSFDGVGCHDFLRGVPGAEERTVAALHLLQERGYHVTASMCIHRGNAHVLGETVRTLASLGVSSLKCGSIMELGEWADPQLADLHLSREEELELFERYIPQFFADGAPLSIMMSGAFTYDKDSNTWEIRYHRECTTDEEDRSLSCSVLGEAFYVGPDGMVAPCQGMCDTSLAGQLPNLSDRPLREILTESDYVRYSYATVGDVRRGNDECRICTYVDRCVPSCRSAALAAGDNYYGVDPNACLFFKGGWEERITTVARSAFEEYLRNSLPDCNGDCPHTT